MGFARLAVLLSKRDKARGARDFRGSEVSNYNMIIKEFKLGRERS